MSPWLKPASISRGAPLPRAFRHAPQSPMFRGSSNPACVSFLRFIYSMVFRPGKSHEPFRISCENERGLFSTLDTLSTRFYSGNYPKNRVSEFGNPIVKKRDKVGKKWIESQNHLGRILFMFHNLSLKVSKETRVGDRRLQEEMNYRLRNSLGFITKYNALKILSKLNDPRLAIAFFRWAQTQPRFRSDVYIYSTLVRILGRSQHFREMEGLIWEMEDSKDPSCRPNQVIFNDAIKSYGIAGNIQRVNTTFYRMRSLGIEPNVVTHSILLDIYSKLGLYEEALNVIRSFKLSRLKPDNVFYTSVICLYGKLGWISKAEELFLSMKPPGCVPNTQTFNAMMDVYVKSNRKEEALKLFWKMINANKRPNVVSFSVVVSACMEKGESYLVHLMDEMKKSQVEPDLIFYTEVISQSMKRKRFSMAENFFSEMKKSEVPPNEIPYVFMIVEYVKNSNIARAKELMEEMRIRKLLPSIKLYVLLLQSIVESDSEPVIENSWTLMGEIGHSIHRLLPLLLNIDILKSEDLWKQVQIYIQVLKYEKKEIMCSFLDTLTRLLIKSQLNEVAHKLWQEQRRHGYVVRVHHTKKSWEMDLHDFSAEMAQIAIKHELWRLMKMDSYTQSKSKDMGSDHFNDPLSIASSSQNRKEDESLIPSHTLPETYCIITGWGKNSPVKGMSSVKMCVENYLQSLHSPFRVDEQNSGKLVCNREDLLSWLRSNPDLTSFHLFSN